MICSMADAMAELGRMDTLVKNTTQRLSERSQRVIDLSHALEMVLKHLPVAAEYDPATKVSTVEYDPATKVSTVEYSSQEWSDLLEDTRKAVHLIRSLKS